MSLQIDTLFADRQPQVADFEFNDQVADVFADMIQRSVPGYQTILQGIGDIAKRVVTAHSRVYDLGCSLGAASLSVQRQVTVSPYQIIAIDNSTAMLQQARCHLNRFKSSFDVELRHEDIIESTLNEASLVILNFTLQFLKPEARATLIQKIYHSLQPGGALIISEKLCFESPQIQSLLDDMHIDFKRAQGYSELEISQKRQAIEHVMRPDTLATHQQRLQAAGFTQQHTWFQCMNFISLVAIK
ncbi:MAG: carboxy-S-adenosyl-L-methionine synthase CmoA [Shewanellaceae bacterium]|nr:carboxy-S-adenosyl-L-methionine synthase CmoA [Shewanellaceae bacterium]